MAEYECLKCQKSSYGLRKKRNKCYRCGGRLIKKRPQKFGDSRVDEDTSISEIKGRNAAEL